MEHNKIINQIMMSLELIHPGFDTMKADLLQLDEIEKIELIIDLEDFFNITFDDETFFALSSFEQLAKYITQCKQA